MKEGEKMPSAKEVWYEKQKKWIEKDYQFSLINDGFYILGYGINIVWDQKMYEEVFSLFSDCEHVYCYSYRVGRQGNKIYQIDFSFEGRNLNFSFWSEKNILKSNLSIKGESGNKSSVDMLHLSKDEERKLRKKIDQIIKYVKRRPEYCIKLILKEMEMEENDFFAHGRKHEHGTV